MITQKLYLVKGIRLYKGYTGDSTEEQVKVLVPASDESAARMSATRSMDKIDSVSVLIELSKGLGWDNDGQWNGDAVGFDDTNTYMV